MAKRKSPSTSRKSSSTPRCVVRIELVGLEPPIWRRLELDGALTLEQVHACVQAVFEWENSHLHEFAKVGAGRKPAVERFDSGFDLGDDGSGPPESDVRLIDVFSESGASLHYTYDFGDNWEHEIRLEETREAEKVLPPALCLAGERAGPPDDCGGIWGYALMIEAGLDPEHPEYEEYTEQIEFIYGEGATFDPEHFDLARANRRLAAAVATGYQAWWVD